jgi:putative ATPase
VRAAAGKVVNYLPDELKGRHYYQPSDNGRERDIAERLATLRKQKSDPGKGHG